MPVQVDPRNQIPPLSSPVTQTTATSQSTTPSGLANVGSSIQTHEQVSEQGWIHWIKEKLGQLFQSLLSCFSCLFCRTAPNTVPPAQTPAAQPAETAETLLNQRIEKGIEVITRHFEDAAFRRWDSGCRNIVVLKYNEQIVLSMHLLSRGVDALKAGAIEELRRLLNSPTNRSCENGRLRIENFIIHKRDPDNFGIRNLGSSIQFTGATQSIDREENSGGTACLASLIIDHLGGVISSSGNPHLLRQAVTYAAFSF